MTAIGSLAIALGLTLTAVAWLWPRNTVVVEIVIGLLIALAGTWLVWAGAT